MRWRDEAACRGMPKAFFYPSQRHDIYRAQQFCVESCGVVDACLDDAMVTEVGLPYRFGVRGGLNASERTELALTDPRWQVAEGRELSEVEVLAVFVSIAKAEGYGEPTFEEVNCDGNDGGEPDRPGGRFDPLVEGSGGLG